MQTQSRWLFHGWRCGISIKAAGVALLLAALASTSYGINVYTLVNGNASVNVSPGNGMAMLNWQIDGNALSSQQWLSAGSGPMNWPLPIGADNLTTITQPTGDSLNLDYANGQIGVNVLYSLVGGASGSGEASLNQQVQIQNLGSSSLNFWLYANAGYSIPGIVQFPTAGNLYSGALVSGAGAASGVSVNTEFDPGAAYVTGHAADNVGVNGVGAAWTAGWAYSLAPGETALLTQSTGVAVVPEPSLLAIGIPGLLLLLATRKRWRFKAA